MQKKIKIIPILILLLSAINQVSAQNPKANNKITGNIYIGDNLLPSGTIYIINKTARLNKIYTEKIRTGTFTFNGIESENYLIYAIPELQYDNLYYPKYIPTYFGNSHNWEKATTFNLDKSSFNIDFSLISYQEPFYGNKKISGKLFFSIDFYESLQKNLPVTIILLNENLVPMDFRTVDKTTGLFSFENIPEGTYYLHPEIPGIKSQNFKISFDNHNNNFDNINFNISEEKIKLKIEHNELKPLISEDFIKILLDEKTNFPVVCELIDLTGKTVIRKLYESNEITINTNKLASNIYILKIKTFDNNPVKTTKVFIRNY